MPQAVQVEWLLSGYMNGGEPLSSGKVFFYETDGTTLKDVYLDASKSTTASNPVILDVNGKAEVFASDTYTVIVKDSQDVTIATLENQYYFPNSGTVSTSEIDASNFGSGDTGISLAITSAAGSDKTVYLNPGNWAISDDLTIPSNINLKFLFGAYVTIASTKTLTIQGTIEAPNYNIFKGSGTVSYDDRTNIIPSIWAIGGSHDDLTLDGLITVKDGFLIQGISQIPLNIQRNEDGVSTTLIKLDRTSASPADNDYYDISFNAENDNNQQHEFARIRMKQLDVSDTTEKGQLIFSLADGVDGSVDDVLVLDNSGATVTGNMVISGNMTVSGTTTTINSTTVTIDDPIFTLGGDTAPTSDDNKDRGIEFRWHNGSVAKLGFFGFDDSTGKFTFIPDATNSSEVFSGTAGTIVNNLEGNVTGNVTGDLTGTILTASQTNITGVGALSAGSITNTFGNIDIGSSNLTATGTISLGATSFNDNDVTNIGDIQVDSISGDADTDTKINFLGGNALSIDTGGSERLRIDSSGNVGIGTTTPDTEFHLSLGGTGEQGNITFTIGNESQTARQAQIIKNTSTPYELTILSKVDSGTGVPIVFKTSSDNEGMRITSTGVGIGDSSPVTKFDVTSGSTIATARFGRHNNYGLFIHSEAESTHYNWLISTQDQVGGALEIGASTAVGGTTWASPVLTVRQWGALGINKISPSYELDVSGSIGYSGSLVNTSDRTTKENINDCPDSVVEKLLKIQSKTFNMIDSADNKDYFGFIAQDIQPLFPNLVQARDDGQLTLSYIEFIPLLLEAIKDLNVKVKELQSA